MISKTLALLRAQVQVFADTGSIGASTRHTTTQVNAAINSAIRRYTLILTANGMALDSRATLTTTAGTADVSGWPANEVVLLPSTCARVLSVSVQIGSRWVPMVQFEEEERDDTSHFWGDQIGIPTQYRVGTTNAVDGMMLRLLPPCDAVYSLRLLYVAEPVALSADGDVAYFISGTEEWVELDAAMELLGRDGVPENGQIALWQARQKRTEGLLKQFRTMGHVTRKIDTAKMRVRAIRASNTKGVY